MVPKNFVTDSLLVGVIGLQERIVLDNLVDVFDRWRGSDCPCSLEFLFHHLV